MLKHSTPPVKLFTLCLLLISVLFAGTARAQFPYGSSFKNSTAPGMVFNGNPSPAFLTADPVAAAAAGITPDADGAGYLRLTAATSNQRGYARSVRTFPSENGINVTFEYYTYGGSGADGISFMLFDAAVSPIGIGGFGGSLGYAQRDTDPGLTGAYLGIGIDEFGNFSLGGAGFGQGRQGGPGARPSSITIRGDGHGAGANHPLGGSNNNYLYLTHVQTTVTPVPTFNIAGGVAPRTAPGGFLDETKTGYRKINIVLTPNGKALPDKGHYITIKITENHGSGSTEHTIVNDYEYIPQSSIYGTGPPTDLAYAFAASTGGFTNVHEIRAITAYATAELPPILQDTSITRRVNNNINFTVDDFYLDDIDSYDLSRYADPNADPLVEIKITDLPDNGDLELTAGATAPGIVILNQVISLADLAFLVYKPDLDYEGADSFMWNGTDGTGSGTGGEGYAEVDAKVEIDMVPNQAPAGTDKTVTINEDASHTFAAADFGFTDPNDDPADAFKEVIITTVPGAGALELNDVAVTDGQTIVVADIPNLVFTPAADANGAGYASFTFQVVDDGDLEGDTPEDTDQSPNTITFNVTAVNDEPSFTKGADETVLEDAGAQTVATWATAIIPGGGADENSQTLTFTVTNDNNALFSAQPAIASNGTLTYTPAADANGTAVVSVVLKDDGGTADGGDDTYATQTFNITVTAVNDEPSFTKGADETVLEDAGAQTVATWATAIVPGGGADENSQTLSFTVTNDNNALFSAQPAIAANGTLTYTPAADANGTAVVTVVLKDDGGTANGGDDTYATQTFNITVTAVNDEPSFTKGADETVLEDAGAQTVATWATAIIPGGGADENSQTLSFTVTNDNNALFSAQPAIASNGTLTYTPAADANGTAVVTVVLKDDGGTANGGDDTYATQTFNITVTAVNDEPSFTKGADETVLEDAGAQTVATWATAIVPGGGADENSQTLTFTVTNDNNALFSAQPAIAANGTLTYTPAADANGTAVVTVVLKDDGGTADGGDDTYATQTFNITVTAVNDEPSFTKGADETVLEDAGAQTVATWATAIVPGGGADENSQTLTFTVTNDNNALFSAQPAIAANGTLTYTPAADANGTAVVTVVLKDDGGTADGGDDTYATQTFNITVTAVNDEPSFTKGADETVLEDAGAQTVATWATAIIPGGGADENSQTLTFTVTNDNNALFSAQPAIAANGTLTYTPAADANGMAVVTVVLKDDGGTANGGDDTYATQTFNITVTAVNDAPVAVADAFTVAEGGTATTLTGGATSVLTNDTDTENDPLTAILVTDVTNGTLTLNADGTFSYEHDGSETTSDSFTYKVDDGTVDGNTVTVTITVTPVNDAPVTVADMFTVVKGGTATILTGGNNSVLDNDSDTENDPLTAILVTDVTNGTLVLNADGTFSYEHDAGTSTSDSFTYKANDGTADGNTVTVTITINAVNDAPVTVADAFTVVKGGTATTLTGGATSVLTNDTDTENDPLTAILVSDVTNGTLTLNADGTFSYTHDGGTSTSDSFTYKANDGTADGNTVTVTITINAVNDAPVTVADAFTVVKGGTATTLTGGNNSVLDNDTDTENDPLTAMLVSDVTNGTLTLNADGTFSYTHDGGTSTSDSFTYKANDGTDDGNTVTVTITITNTVNNAPVAVADAFTVTEGGTATILTGGNNSVLDNDTDTENDPLTALLVNDVTNGTLTLNQDGTFSYTHDGGETTSDSFTYKANDGTEDGNTVTVTITITPINDIPVVANISRSMVKNTVLSFTAAHFTSQFTDDDGEALDKIRIVSLPGNGVLKLDGTAITTAGLEIPAADLSKITYEPATDYTGSDTFKWSGSDGTAYAPADGNVNITINASNSAPTVADITKSGLEDEILTFAEADFVSKYSDPEMDGLEKVKIISIPANGILKLNNTAITAGQEIMLGDLSKITFEPSADFNGNTSFKWNASDGTVYAAADADVDITILPVNDAPSFTEGANQALLSTAGAQTVPGWATVISKGPANESGQTLSFTVTNNNNALFTVQPAISAAGVLTYTPSGLAGTATVTVVLKDNGGVSNGGSDSSAPKTFTVTLTAPAVNTPPVAANDIATTPEDTPVTIPVRENDSDPDNDPLTITTATVTTGTVTINTDGTLTYTPLTDYTGTAVITYTISDGKGGTATATVTVTVTENRSIAINVTEVCISDVPWVQYIVTGTGFTPAANSVTIQWRKSDGTLVQELTNQPLTGQLLWPGAAVDNNGKPTAWPGWNFVNGAWVQVADGLRPDMKLHISVNPETEVVVNYPPATPLCSANPNLPPVAAGDTYSTTQGGTLAQVLPGVLSNDSDPEGQAITAIKVTDPVNGILSLNADGSFIYVHNGGASTSDSFTYKVNDGNSDGNTVTVTINITAINNPPVVAELPKTGTGFLPIPFTPSDFVDKFSDTDSDPLMKIRIDDLPPLGVLKLNGTPVTAGQEIPVADLGGLAFEPPLNWAGTTTFPWTGSDGKDYALTPADVRLTVALAGDPTAKIGLAKHLAAVTSALNGTYDLKFVFTLMNFGENGLENVSLRDNLALAFGSLEVKVTSVTASGNLIVNNAFNGFSDTELLLTSSKLEAAEEAKVELLINVKPSLSGGQFENFAIAEAISAINGVKVTDQSTNGLKPDPVTAEDVSPAEVTQILLDAFPTFVPQGFSPNGDGQNDKFVIQNADGKHIALEVFNRWGNRVYRSADYNNDWGGEVTEGFFIGRDIPDGTYYYIIIIDRKDKYTGFITINR